MDLTSVSLRPFKGLAEVYAWPSGGREKSWAAGQLSRAVVKEEEEAALWHQLGVWFWLSLARSLVSGRRRRAVARKRSSSAHRRACITHRLQKCTSSCERWTGPVVSAPVPSPRPPHHRPGLLVLTSDCTVTRSRRTGSWTRQAATRCWTCVQKLLPSTSRSLGSRSAMSASLNLCSVASFTGLFLRTRPTSACTHPSLLIRVPAAVRTTRSCPFTAVFASTKAMR